MLAGQLEQLPCPLYSRIVQHGEARSASTFQWYMLCSIQRACVLEANLTLPVVCDLAEPAALVREGRPFLHVAKLHKWLKPFNFSHGSGVAPGEARPALPSQGDAAVFISQMRDTRQEEYIYTDATMPPGWGHIVYRQIYTDFVREGLAVLHRVYRPMFQLSEKSTLRVHRHMKLWQVLRTCCGSQQSLQHRAVLHNFSVRAQHYHNQAYDDPDCETYNLAQLEAAFLETDLARAYPRELYFSEGRGSLERIYEGACNAWEKKIRAGYDFGGKAAYIPPPSPHPPPRPPHPPHPPRRPSRSRREKIH
jgi:hypothetical protein